jgi:hypothetical protein
MDITEIRHGLDSSGSGQDAVAGYSENGNEPLGSIEGGEFRDQMSDRQLHKKGLAPGS